MLSTSPKKRRLDAVVDAIGAATAELDEREKALDQREEARRKRDDEKLAQLRSSAPAVHSLPSSLRARVGEEVDLGGARFVNIGVPWDQSSTLSPSSPPLRNSMPSASLSTTYPETSSFSSESFCFLLNKESKKKSADLSFAVSPFSLISLTSS